MAEGSGVVGIPRLGRQRRSTIVKSGEDDIIDTVVRRVIETTAMMSDTAGDGSIGKKTRALLIQLSQTGVATDTRSL